MHWRCKSTECKIANICPALSPWSPLISTHIYNGDDILPTLPVKKLNSVCLGDFSQVTEPGFECSMFTQQVRQYYKSIEQKALHLLETRFDSEEERVKCTVLKKEYVHRSQSEEWIQLERRSSAPVREKNMSKDSLAWWAAEGSPVFLNTEKKQGVVQGVEMEVGTRYLGSWRYDKDDNLSTKSKGQPHRALKCAMNREGKAGRNSHAVNRSIFASLQVGSPGRLLGTVDLGRAGRERL